MRHLWKVKEVEYENIMNLVSRAKKVNEWLDMVNINIITFHRFPFGHGNEQSSRIPSARFCKFRWQYGHLMQRNAIDFYGVASSSNLSMFGPCRVTCLKPICKCELNCCTLHFTIIPYILYKCLLAFLFELILPKLNRNL